MESLRIASNRFVVSLKHIGCIRLHKIRLWIFLMACQLGPSITLPCDGGNNDRSEGPRPQLLCRYLLRDFPGSQPAALYGPILVRNVAFKKRVALSLTIDGCQTTSEVLHKHVVDSLMVRAVLRSSSGTVLVLSSTPSFYEYKHTEHNMISVGRSDAPGVGE